MAGDIDAIKEYTGWEFRVFHYKIFEFKDTLPHDFEVNKYNYANNKREQNNELFEEVE